MKTTFSGWRYLWKSEDIRRKLIITFAILALYRLAANVPAPGVNFDVLAAFRAHRRAAAASSVFLICSLAVRSPTSHCFQWVFIRTLQRRLSCSC